MLHTKYHCVSDTILHSCLTIGSNHERRIPQQPVATRARTQSVSYWHTPRGTWNRPSNTCVSQQGDCSDQLKPWHSGTPVANHTDDWVNTASRQRSSPQSYFRNHAENWRNILLVPRRHWIAEVHPVNCGVDLANHITNVTHGCNPTLEHQLSRVITKGIEQLLQNAASTNLK